MWIYIIIPLVLISVLVSLYLLYRRKNKDPDIDKYAFTNPNTKNKAVVYTYLTCERCNKKNYVNQNSLSKLCNNCGWNLTEPYIHTSLQISIPQNIKNQQVLSKIKIDEQVYIRISDFEDSISDFENTEYRGNLLLDIYDKNNQHIGIIPINYSDELASKMLTCIRVFGKVKRKSAIGIEILVTNDIQKMWGY